MEYLLQLQTIRDNAPSLVNYFFLGISEFITVGGILIAAYIYWCTSKRAGAYILASFSGGYMLNQIVKNTACIYRPWVSDPRIHLADAASESATGYSFPSGHTLSATTVYGGAGIYNSKNKPFVALMAILVVLTAFARNWLGAHALQDVLVAALEGVAVLIINAMIINWLMRKDESDNAPSANSSDNLSSASVPTIKRRLVLMIIGLCFILASMLYLELKPYPMDYDASGNLLVDPWEMLTDCYTGAGMFSGFLIGWFIEKRFINYELPVSSNKKATRFIIGTVGLILIYLVIMPVITKPFDAHIGHLLKYFMVFFWVSGLYPALIKWYDKRKKHEIKNRTQ